MEMYHDWFTGSTSHAASLILVKLQTTIDDGILISVWLIDYVLYFNNEGETSLDMYDKCNSLLYMIISTSNVDLNV